MNSYDYSNFTRVQKRTARKLHDKGVRIAITPCNMQVGNPWTGFCVMDLDVPFDSYVAAFEYYNCNNICGYYAAFYVINP